MPVRPPAARDGQAEELRRLEEGLTPTSCIATRSSRSSSAPTLEEISKPNESERDFRVRLQQAAREERDQQAEQLRQKFAPKIAAVDETNSQGAAGGREEEAGVEDSRS